MAINRDVSDGELKKQDNARETPTFLNENFETPISKCSDAELGFGGISDMSLLEKNKYARKRRQDMHM